MACQPVCCPSQAGGWGLTFSGGDVDGPCPRNADSPCSGIAFLPLPGAHLRWGHRKRPPLRFLFPQPLSPSPKASSPRPAPIGWWLPLWDTHLSASVTLGLSGPPSHPLPLPRPWTQSLALACLSKLQTPPSSCLPRVPTADSGTHSWDPLRVPHGQGPGRLRPGSRSLSAKGGRRAWPGCHRHRPPWALTSCSPAPSDTQPRSSHECPLCRKREPPVPRPCTGSSFLV